MKKKLTILTFFIALCTLCFGQSMRWTAVEGMEDNMALLSVVKIGNDLQASPDLELAAFKGDECRGTVKLQYVNIQNAIDGYFAYLTIHGEEGESFTFKLYDHPSKTEYVLSNSTIEFNKEATQYNEFNPFVVTFIDGTGSSENPYLIGNLDELNTFLNSVNVGNKFDGEFIKLTADIDLATATRSAVTNWEPIGTSENPFQGTFDGGGNTIKNLNIVETEAKEGKAYIGFFGYAKDATIKNVVFENVNLDIACLDIDHSQGHIGAVAGSLEGTSKIEDVTVKGDITVEATFDANGASRVAVVAGGNSYGNVTMKNVHVFANEGSYLKANNNVGALAGQLQGKNVFENCSSNINVTGKKFFAGGIIGLAAGDSQFTDCQTTGNVTITAGREGRANDHYRVGGIAGGWADGKNNVCTLTDCSYTGEISGTNADGSVAKILDYAGYVGRGYTLQDAGSKVVIDGVEYVQAFDNVHGLYKIDGVLTLNTADHLKNFATKVNGGNSFIGETIKLGDNIDLNNEEWTPIGNNTNQFKGYFDGNNKTISNLKVTGNTRYKGFFGYIKGTGMSATTTPSVKDLTLDGVNVNVEGDGYFVGGLAGQAYTCNITNVTVKGNVSGVRYVGGLVGHVYTYFKDCHFIGNASCSFDALGGIAGAGDCRAYDCSVIGDVTGSNWVGGIVGNGQEGTSAVGCYVKGDVKTSNNYYRGVGGIAGVAGHGYASSEFKNNYFDGEVYLGDVKVSAMIMGLVNANDNASIKATVEGNSWNTDYYDVNTPVYVVAEISSPDASLEDWIDGASEELTKPRNNNLIMLESDLQYVTEEDYVIMSFSEVTEEQVEQALINNAVAKIGETTYTTLQKALDAAVAGTGNVTVEIIKDIDLTGIDWNPVTVSAPGYPVVTVEGNDKTITGLNDMLFAGTWAGNSGLIINNLTIANSNIVNDENDAIGTVGVGAFIGFPQASATITLNDCHLVNSTVKGGHWTGGLIGYAAGYAGPDGPVFMNLTITGCSVTESTITGKGSVGGIIGHGSGNAWTDVVIEGTTVSGNTITSTGTSTNKAGAIMGTIGAAGQPTTVNGVTHTGGMSVSATVAENEVKSNGTEITTIYGRQGTSTGMLELAGGLYDNYPIEEGVTYAAPAEGYKIEDNGNGTYGVVVDPAYGKVAKVGDVYYETLAEAIAAAQTGDVVTLIRDVEASEVILLGRSVTINGEGHKVTSSATRVFRVTTANTEVTLNDVKMVSTAVRVGTNDVRGISIDIVENVKLTLNNSSVDFTDASANDWAYAVNVTGGNNHVVIVDGGEYEGANVINVNGAENTITVKDAVITCTYPNNDQYYGACIWVLQNQGSSVEATGNTFNGSNAIAFNLGTGTALTESENIDNTKMIVAKVDSEYYTSLAEAVAAADGNTVKILHSFDTDETVTVNGDVTLDLNGKTVTMVYTQKATKNHTMISNSGNLTIQSSVEGGKLSYTYAGENLGTTYSANTVTSNPGSVLTVKSGTIENLTFDSGIIAYAIDGLTNGGAGDVTVNIEGGVITSKRQALRIFANSTTNTGALNISGGDFTGRVIVQNANAEANKAALNITGGTFSANEYKTDVLYVGGSQSATIDIEAIVSGGTFNGEITDTHVAGFITGGTFTTDVNAYCAEGFQAEANGDGTYSIQFADYIVLPEGVTAANCEQMFGDNTVTDGTNYYKTMVEALNAIHNTDINVLYCKPGAHVGAMTHGHVCQDLTVYGNGAYVYGGEQEFEVDTYAHTCSGLQKDLTLIVNYLHGAGAWGQRKTENAMNLVFNNCENMSRIYFTGTTGNNNIDLTGCTFTSNTGGNCKLYSNANGTINVTDCEFSNVHLAINLNHKVAGEQIVNITNTTFDGVGCSDYDYAAPVRVLSSVEGATSDVTIDGCAFTNTVANSIGQDADILLDYAISTTVVNVSGTSAKVIVEKEENVNSQEVVVTKEQNATFTNGVMEVAMIDDVKYTSLAAAFEAAQENDVIVLISNVTEEFVISNTANITLDMEDYTLTGAILPSTANVTIKNGTINNSNAGCSAIEINAGTLNLNNVNISSARHAVRIDGEVVATIDGGEYNVSAYANNKTRHAVNVSGNAQVTIVDGTFVGPYFDETSDSGSALNVQTGATVTVEGGNFSGGKRNTLSAEGTLVVKGGTYTRQYSDDTTPENFLAPGYVTEQVEENVYTVKRASFEKFYTAAGVETTSDDAAYSLSFTVTDYANNKVSVKIGSKIPVPNSNINLVTPSEVQFEDLTFNVTSVADNGFNGTSFKKVTISEGVETIGNKALYFMSKLTELVLPKTLVSVGEQCIGAYNPSSVPLKSIVCYAEEAPSAFEPTSNASFQTCVEQQTILIVPNAADYTVYSNASGWNFTNIIGVGATKEIAGKDDKYTMIATITSIEPNECSIQIGNTKPANNSNAELVLPETVTFFEGYDFNVTSIPNNAFSSCLYFVGDLVIPQNVRTIGTGAFNTSHFVANETVRGTLTLNEGLVSIGSQAFKKDYFKGDLSIPSTVETIASNAFQYASFDGTLTINANINCANAFGGTGFTKLVLVEGVEEIKDSNAFSGMTELKEVVLPLTLQTVGMAAFKDDNAIEVIHTYATEVPAINSIPGNVNYKYAFSETVKANAVLYVHGTSYDDVLKYKNATNEWKEFQNIHLYGAVAQIEEVEYLTLQAAMNAAENGKTITLLADVEAADGNPVLIPEGVTLDINTHNVTANIYGTVKTSGGLWTTVTVPGFNSRKMLGNGAIYNTTDATVANSASEVKMLAGSIVLNPNPETEWWTLPNQNLSIASGASFEVPANIKFTVRENTHVVVDGTLTVNGDVYLQMGATVKAAAGLNILTDVEGYMVSYENGVYSVVQAIYTQTTQLSAGWNWFSYYVNTDLTALETALGTNGIEIKSQNNGFVRYQSVVYNGETYYYWNGNLETISETQMYMINTNDSYPIEISGNIVDHNQDITLNKGWNWIGYPTDKNVDINEALKNLNPIVGDEIKTQDNGYAQYVYDEQYQVAYWNGSLNTLIAGEGYKYYSSADDIVSFKYNISSDRGELKANVTTDGNHWIPDAGQYPNNMTMTAMVEVEGGDYEVAAFVNGECRGSARPIYIEAMDAHILFLTIHGEDVEEMTFRYYDLATGEEFDLNDRMNYSNDAIVGTIAEPYIFSRGTTGIGEASLSEVNIYPNPTTTGTEINLQATCDTVEVFNALGVKVAEYHNVDSLDAFETAGIYVIRLTNNGDVKHCRLVVK